MGKIYLGDELLAYDVDSTLDSGSTNPVANSGLTEELDKKLDKVNFINNLFPKGSVYITYEYKNPSEFLGGTWELIGGEDADKNYYPAFAIDTDTAGTTINESLPNINGRFSAYDYENGWHEGALIRNVLNPHANAGGSETPWHGYYFNAASGSTVSGVYQDGAHVNVNAIKLFHWRRTDDGTIVEQITPLDVDVTDVLWEGTSATEASVSLTMAKSLFGYKEIVLIVTNSDDWNQNTQAKSLTLNDYNRIVEAGGTALISLDWDGTSRFINGIQYLDDGMTFKAWVSGCKIRKIVGIKPVPTSDATAEVTDVLFSGSIGGGTAEVTLSNNFEEYKTLKITFLAATSWVMVRYIDTTDIKPRYLFDLNWANDAYRYCYFQGTQPSSGNKLLIDATSDVYITKVEGIKRYSAIDISAGDGINISEGGVISVEHPTNVIEVTGKLDGNGYLYDVGGVSGAKVRLPKNAIMTGVNIKEISNLSVGAGFQIIFFQYYYPSETYSQWCFRILNWDDAKLGEKNNVVADISYILI